MGKLVSVVESSMGPRREPMTFISTTAGIIQAGPFIDKLENIKQLLKKELDPTAEHTISEDRQSCLLLEPDDWEKTDHDLLLTSKEVRRKVNPMLGIIVQHSFYDDEVAKGRQNPEKMNEVITKLMNVYQVGTVQEWIKPEVIRGLQNDKTIDDYRREDGWVIFTGLDFSQGDDLHTAGYLAARKHHSGHGYELFADFDAWIKQDVLEKSSIRPLYEEWIQKGWLHVSPGAVFQPSLFVIRFDKLLQRGCQFQYFGYDPYQSKDPINTLKAYLQEKGVAQPDKYVLPVSQRNAWFNAPTDDLAKAIKSPIPYITFSANPMWPWLFGNCVLSIDGKAGAAVDMDLGNKKPVKRNPGSDSCKVDPIQCICVALGLMTEYEGKNH
jgi:phage terminase large subunit-like protein